MQPRRRAPSGSRKRPRRGGGVGAWGTSRVVSYLRECAGDWADDVFANKVRDEGMDGAALLSLTKQDLKDKFGIKELGRVKRLLAGIASIQKSTALKCVQPAAGGGGGGGGGRSTTTRQPAPPPAPTPQAQQTLQASPSTTPPTTPSSHTPVPRPPPPPHPPSTPDPESFDVLISEEDMQGWAGVGAGAGSAGCDDGSSGVGVCGGRFGADGSGACGAGGATRATTRTPPPLHRPAPPSPTPLAAAPPPRLADYDSLEIGEEDTIQLCDLMPDGGAGNAEEHEEAEHLKSLPRPVTAIGHRPLHGMMDEDHRHVWADDPAVHIRRASDLLHEVPASEVLTPEAIEQLSSKQVRRPFTTNDLGSDDPWTPPRAAAPVLENLRPASSLASSRPSDAALAGAHPLRHTQAGERRAAPDADTPSSLHLLDTLQVGVRQSGVGTAGYVIDIDADPYDNSVLEQERQYSELQRLYTLWVTCADPSDFGITSRSFQQVIQAFCGWSDGEAAVNCPRILEDVDVNSDGVLDWHEFCSFVTQLSKSMPPPAFDNLVSHFASCIAEGQGAREKQRREGLLTSVFKAMDAGSTGAVCVRDLQCVLTTLATLDTSDEVSVVQRVSEVLLSATSMGAVNTILCGRDTEVADSQESDMTVRMFTDIVHGACDGVPAPVFDLFIFRMKRAVAAALSPSRETDAEAPPFPHTKASVPALTSDDLDTIVSLSPSSSPLVLVGTGVDPTQVLTECAASCGVSLAILFITCEQEGREAAETVKSTGFVQGNWVCVSVDPRFRDCDNFLRSLGLCMHTGSSWAVHRKFRLWVHIARHVVLPSILAMSSVRVDLEEPDAFPVLVRDLEKQTEKAMPV